MAALSVCSDTRKTDRRRPSCDTLCSSNSSCILQKRKPLHPLATGVRSKTSSNPVAQRVLSAKLLRFRALQNQLNDANYHITQLTNENKLLKTLQKRQDHALSKYEGVNAQLPQVLESHQEEIRILQLKNKNLRKSLKELSDTVKNKDEEINSLKDQNKHLSTLCKNKNLEERKELADKVEELNEQLRKNESTISVLNRKLMLESKNYKFKLNSEVIKHKETQKKLNKALLQLNKLTSNSEMKFQRSKSTDRKSQSVICLENPVKTLTAFKKPTENSSSETNLSDDLVSSNSSEKGIKIQEISSISEFSKSSEQELDSSSETQLKEIVNTWQKRNNQLDQIEKQLQTEIKTYASEIITNAKHSNNIIDKHTLDFNNSTKDTKVIMETLKETDDKHAKLTKLKTSGDKMSFYDYTVMSSISTNEQLMSQLLQNGTTLKYNYEDDLLNETSKKLTLSEPEVAQEDKKKLLEKLKAIDNGDNLDITERKQAKCHLLKELFGS